MLLRVLFFEQKEVQYANTLVSLRRFKLPGILEIRLTTEPKKKKMNLLHRLHMMLETELFPFLANVRCLVYAR